MVRSSSTISAFIATKISDVVTRRGYAAAASQGSALSSLRSGAPTPNHMLKRGSEEPTKIPWVLDPVTGYYRPENCANEIDAVELRAMLIGNKFSRTKILPDFEPSI